MFRIQNQIGVRISLWSQDQEDLGSSVADPDPGSGAFLTPGSGMEMKSQDPDLIFENFVSVFGLNT